MQVTQETWIQSLGQEIPLEKGMATLSSSLAGKTHGQRSMEGYSPWDHEELDTTWRLNNNSNEGQSGQSGSFHLTQKKMTALS